MPLFLAPLAWAGGSALVAMAIKAMTSSSESDVAQLKAAHQKLIYENQRNGMDAQESRADADAKLQEAISAAEEDVASQGIGNYAVAGATAAALGPVAGKALGMAAKWGGKGLAKIAPKIMPKGTPPAAVPPAAVPTAAVPVTERGLVATGRGDPAWDDALNFRDFRGTASGAIPARRPMPYRMYRPQQQLGYEAPPAPAPLGYAAKAQPPQLGYGGSRIYAEAPQKAIPLPGGMPVRGEVISPEFRRASGQWIDEVGDTGIAPRMVDDFTPFSGGGTMLRGPGQFAEPGSPQQMAFQRMLDQAMLRRRMYGIEGG